MFYEKHSPHFPGNWGYPKMEPWVPDPAWRDGRSLCVLPSRLRLVISGDLRRCLQYPPPNLLPSEVSAWGSSLSVSVAVEGQGSPARVKRNQRKDPLCKCDVKSSVGLLPSEVTIASWKLLKKQPFKAFGNCPKSIQQIRKHFWNKIYYIWVRIARIFGIWAMNCSVTSSSCPQAERDCISGGCDEQGALFSQLSVKDCGISWEGQTVRISHPFQGITRW